eukprot:1767724-Pleurochrysis_carterae.AAC.1
MKRPPRACSRASFVTSEVRIAERVNGAWEVQASRERAQELAFVFLREKTAQAAQRICSRK